VVEPGDVYLIPAGSELTMRDGKLCLKAFDDPRGFRRPIDTFLRSLAAERGANCAAVILSGTGSDENDLIRATLEGTLSGMIIPEYEPNGFRCVIELPFSRLNQGETTDELARPIQVEDPLR